jgi:two-component system cell cycle sensor histidine kinase/response regulator CckA
MMGAATVLVVDSEPDLLKIATAMLEGSCHVLTADSAVAALNILHGNQRVDLVLSESTLTRESGSDLIRSVQHEFPSVAVMLMNAYTEEALDPAVPCVQKPFTAIR